MLLEWTAAGVAVAAVTCQHVGTVYSVGGKLQEGRRRLDDTLAICLEDGSDFESSDATEIGATYRKLKATEKDIEADDVFPKNIFPSTITAARGFASRARKLYFQTASVSQEGRARRVPFITAREPQDVVQGTQLSAYINGRIPTIVEDEPLNHSQHDSRGPVESGEDADHRSILTVLEYEGMKDAAEEDFSSLQVEASSSSRKPGENISSRLRRRGQNWIPPKPLPAVHLSPLSALFIDFPNVHIIPVATECKQT